MRALIDADSLAYKAWYVVENQPLTDSEKIAEGLEVIASMEMSMYNEAEDELGVCFDGFEYFFTTCTKNFRKDLVSRIRQIKTANPMVTSINYYEGNICLLYTSPSPRDS